MEHFIYILKCADDTLYTGYTTDVARRVIEHNGEGKLVGAKYTASRRPVRLVYQESFVTRSDAMKREAEIKNFSRAQKEKLIKV
jgi:putative endonuclease